MTERPVPAPEFPERRQHRVAEVARQLVFAVTARLEWAAGRRVERRGDVALEHNALLPHPRVCDRHRREQRLGIGVVRRLENWLVEPVSTTCPRYITMTRSAR